MTSPMALAVGITDDAAILPDATAENLHGDGDVPSATAGAIDDPALHEEAVDYANLQGHLAPCIPRRAWYRTWLLSAWALQLSALQKVP